MAKSSDITLVKKNITQQKDDSTAEQKDLNFQGSSEYSDKKPEELTSQTRKDGLLKIKAEQFLKKAGIWIALLLFGTVITILIIFQNRDVGVILNNQSTAKKDIDSLKNEVKNNKTEIQNNRELMIENFTIIKERMKSKK